MSDSERNHRLFFALWPSNKTRETISKTLAQASLSHSGGKKMSPENYHITLHFIGNVSKSTMDCLHRAAERVVARPVDLKLDQFGFFRKPKLFWIGMETIPESLARLHQLLGHAFQHCGYTMEHRSFLPHVTLMRKITGGTLPTAPSPIDWHASEFVLVESTTDPEGATYQVLHHYPLTG